jgi:hypothetical protein
MVLKAVPNTRLRNVKHATGKSAYQDGEESVGGSYGGGRHLRKSFQNYLAIRVFI